MTNACLNTQKEVKTCYLGLIAKKYENIEKKVNYNDFWKWLKWDFSSENHYHYK